MLLASIDFELIWVICQVALGLGAVIFVHELGHFLVAKWCGVRCDKFYLGFDPPLRIGPIKLPSRIWRKKWGETEYGIGILPLGGYVKMLGQDDNPAAMAEEIEKAKRERAEGGEEAAEKPLFDPRSYQAKSVPQRMAIISAGVIMNLIFAVIFATIAYGMGAKYTPTKIAQAMPGEPAWKEGLRPGDEIVELNGIKNPKFRDLRIQVALAWKDHVETKVQRYGSGEVESIDIDRDRDHVSQRLLPTIGVSIGGSTTLDDLEDGTAVYSYSAASKAEPAFQPGDKVVAINGEKVDNYGDINRELALHVDEEMQFTVERAGGERVDIQVERNPLPRVGLIMEWGEVAAVQKQGPAAQAGVRSGDVIKRLGDKPAAEWDPVTLPAQIRRLAMQGQESIQIVVERDGKEETFDVPLRKADWYEEPYLAVSVPELGLAYDVGRKIVGLVEGTPAAKHQELVGQELAELQVVVPEDTEDAQLVRLGSEPLEFGELEHNWVYFVQQFLPRVPRDLKLELRFTGENAIKPLKIGFENSDEFFLADRGLAFKQEQQIAQAESIGDAIAMGFHETTSSVLQVYLFIQKLVTGEISSRALGGPITIARAAGTFAYEGLPELLIFLTLLSANLAVINFLPIPVLDGGHMVFLAYEGIFKRPANVKVQEALTFGGLALLLCLMVWVFGLDLGLIPRN